MVIEHTLLVGACIKILHHSLPARPRGFPPSLYQLTKTMYELSNTPYEPDPDPPGVSYIRPFKQAYLIRSTPYLLRIRTLFLACLFLVPAWHLSAQQQYLFSHLGIKEGLVANSTTG